MRMETHNLGDGPKKHAVYDLPVIDTNDYWANVTDVPCPVCAPKGENGIIRWMEAGYVPGSRICDWCGRFFEARGSIAKGITLVRDARFDKQKGWTDAE